MSNILEYTLSLQDQISAKLQKIGINSDEALNVFSELQKQSQKVSQVMGAMGTSIGTLSQKLELLKREKQWIPANNEKDIRAVNREIMKLEKQITRLNTLDGSRLKKWFGDLRSQVPMFNALFNPLTMVGVGIYKLTGYIRNSTEAYKQQAVAETKLTAIMRNTMNATESQVRSILDLASAQQKLGVIGDEIQIAGAQELATYVTKKESLEKLMPAMNDMLAQQYGLNATQEQAVTIAQMMGKVMDGQVGALSRYGYRFTEAQEKVLKYGNEQQRVAILSEVVTKYVGGVNEALAQTPEGKLKNAANNMGDLSEKVGALWTQVKAAMLPVEIKIQEVMSKLIGFFERNREKIIGVVNTVAEKLSWLLNIIMQGLGWAAGMVHSFFKALDEGKPVVVILAGLIGGLTTALIIQAAWTKAVAIATGIMNAVMAVNPVVAVVMGIVALVAILITAYNKIGWVRGAILAAREAFKGFGIMLKDYVIDRIKGLLSGIAGIGGALVKLFKGDFAGALNQAIEAVGDLMGVDAAKNAVDNAKKVGQKVGSAYIEGVNQFEARKQKAGLENAGIADPHLPGVDGTFNQTPTPEPAGQTTEAIATGGTRNTTVNITIGKSLVDTINIAKAGFTESADEMTDKVLDQLSRVFALAQANANL